MERDTHYFVVGLFVITTLIAGFFFAGLFIKKNNTEQLPYLVYFSTPVEGLMKGSEVRFMGVNVGEVAAVGLLDKPVEGALIEVKVDVAANTPVDNTTVAILRQQSLTGLMYLNLLQTDTAPAATPSPLTTSPAQPAVIPTQLSALDDLLTRLPDIETRLGNVLSAAEDLLNPDNRRTFTALLQHLEQAGRGMPNVLSAAEDLLNPDNRRTFAALLQHLEQAGQGMPDLVNNLTQAATQLSITVQSANQLMAGVDDKLETSISGLNQTLGSIRQTADNINSLVADIDRFVVNNAGKVAALLTQSRTGLHDLLQASRQTVGHVQQLVSSMTRTSERLNITAAQIGGAVGKVESNVGAGIQEFNQTLQAFRKTAWQLNKLVTDVDRIVVTNEGTFNEILGQGGEDIKQLLHEFRRTAQEVRQLSEQLGQDPSQIIYQPTPQGIELPR